MTPRTEVLLVPIGAVVTASAAVTCLGARGLLPAPAVVVAVLLIVAAGWALVRWPGGPGSPHRRTAARIRAIAQSVAGASLLLIAFLALVRVSSAGADPAQLVHGIGTTLSVPLVVLLVAQLGSAITLRELGVVLVGSLLCVVLSLGTMPGGASPDLVSGFGLCLLVCWSAGLVTAWLLHRARELSRSQHWLGGHGPSLRGGALLVAGSVLAGIAALVLLPHPAGIQVHAGLGGSQAVGGPGQTGASAGARSVQSYLSGMDLSARGELPNTRLLDVPADSPTLWGSTQLDTYDGRTWGGSGRAGELVPRDAAGDYDLRLGAVPGLPQGTADRSDLVRVLDHAFLPLLAPGQPVSVRIDDPVAASSIRAIPIAPGSSYVMRSNGSIRYAITGMDTALPSSLPARVRDLAARLARGAPTPQAKVAAIEAYLHAHERYRLDSPVPNDGEDAVDFFLFDSHEGFCEHFASAEAVLLRAMDVPARIVTGFAGGTHEGDRRVLLGSNAHAWVQVAVGGDQWVWTDPTAGATLAADRKSSASAWAWLRAHALPIGALLSAALVLSAVAFLVVRRRRTRRAADLARRAPLAAKVLVAFAALEAALADSRFARPPDASVHELGRALRSGWPGGLPEPDQVAAAFGVVQRILYDGRPVSDREADQAIASLESLTGRAVEIVRVDRQRRVRLSR